MITISETTIKTYRARIYRSQPGSRIHNLTEAVEHVNRLGYLFFWPIQGVEFPSLWVAAAGDRPVPNEHDDPGHVTWGWKDQALSMRLWYYARLLRRKNMMVSLQSAPYFYALSPNYGDYENDFLEDYRRGVLTAEARQVYEALLQKGPLDSIALREAAHLANGTNAGRFARALDDLQVTMRVMPVGVAPAGHFKYAFIYDIVPRYMPEIAEKARFIDEKTARKHLLKQYFLALGAANRRSIEHFFRWKSDEYEQILLKLTEEGFLVDQCQMENQKSPLLCLKALLEN